MSQRTTRAVRLSHCDIQRFIRIKKETNAESRLCITFMRLRVLEKAISIGSVPANPSKNKT